jgi:hypothetical protein
MTDSARSKAILAEAEAFAAKHVVTLARELARVRDGALMPHTSYVRQLSYILAPLKIGSSLALAERLATDAALDLVASGLDSHVQDAKCFRWLMDEPRGNWIWDHVLTEKEKKDYNSLEDAVRGNVEASERAQFERILSKDSNGKNKHD